MRSALRMRSACVYLRAHRTCCYIGSSLPQRGRPTERPATAKGFDLP